jgi:hypothetical protein
MTEEKKGPEEERAEGWHSRSADAAGARWGETHPDEDPPHPPPPHIPEPGDEVPNRHSASAEAANLRWHEQHPDED